MLVVSVNDGMGSELLGCVLDGTVVTLCPRCAVAFLSTRCQLCEDVVLVRVNVKSTLLCVMTLKCAAADVDDFIDDDADGIDGGNDDWR